MSKPEERPMEGGSYTRDPKTGKLTRVAFTAPADPDAPAEDEAEAEPDDALVAPQPRTKEA